MNFLKGKFGVDKDGYYGNFGGKFIPEILDKNIKELEDNYRKIISKKEFQNEFYNLLKNYVGRPTPLYYSKYLSQKYSCKIFLKREDLCHTGAHKINNAIGQILLACYLKKKEIVAETGAGQHGVATATVCALKQMPCKIFMGEIDILRQQPNVLKMKLLGAEVIPALSGSKTLKDATNEALRYWMKNPNNTHYLIGSVVGPHPFPDLVSIFQSVISEEIKIQLKEQTGNPLPNYVISCVGGGSNAIGSFYNFLEDKKVTLIGVEAGGEGVLSKKTAATITMGKPGVFQGSYSMLMQNEDGQVIEPHSISAGLDYPGVGPIHSHLAEIKRAIYIPINDEDAINACFELSKNEGIIPALESSHAIAALDLLDDIKKKIIVINLSGRGDKDMTTLSKIYNEQNK